MNPCCRSSRRAVRGLTLIEAMVALLISAIGITGLATAVIAASGQHRRNSARAAAHNVALELARDMLSWRDTDPRLAMVNSYSGEPFSDPKIVSFDAAKRSETFDHPPDHSDAELGGFDGRSLTALNSSDLGRVYQFRRYWNVRRDPENPNLTLIAIHVTYNRSATARDVITVFSSTFSMAALVQQVGQ